MAGPRLLLAALLVQWGLGAEPPPAPPPPPPLHCTKWEGEKGEGHPVVLRLWGGKAPPPVTSPASDDTFDVIDPWGGLTQLWTPPWTPPKCELSPTVPVVTPPPWAPSVGAPDRSPMGLGGSWWVLSLESPRYGATALLHGEPRAPRLLNASLSLSTLTPSLRARFGSSPSLHCSFTSAPGPFALQWWHRDLTSGHRLLLAYDSAHNRVLRANDGVSAATDEGSVATDHGSVATDEASVATEASIAGNGVLLLLGAQGSSREVSLRLPPLSRHRQGTYGCAVYVRHGQAQQLLSMRVVEPPRVRLRPPLALLPPVGGGAWQELRCEARGFYPQGAELRWLLGGRPLAAGRSSGHRRDARGAFSRSSAVLLRQGALEEGLECEVTHEALREPLRVRLEVEVTGAQAPGTGGAVGLFLVAFGICGLWRRIHSSAPMQDHKVKTQ